jgi:tRNA pseudouridine55 synthase
MEGLVLFNKPKGYTSNQIVEYFKKLTKKKVGHGGTLDPLATGLLIIGVGEGTKELTLFLKNSIKTYLAEIILGYVSDTYDREGKIQTTNKQIPSLDKIQETLNLFVGEVYQKPPPYSAIKIKGKPAYKLTRKGIKVDLKPRKIKIYDLKCISFKDNILNIETTVSSGAYIRSLAYDLGEKLGCGAYLNNLLRTKIEEFSVERALGFEDIENNFLEFRAKVFGKVQGVGYRYFAQEIARNLNIFGYSKNLFDGSVEVVAQGREEDLQKLIIELKKGPFLSKVEKLFIVFQKPLDIYKQFEIRL